MTIKNAWAQAAHSGFANTPVQVLRAKLVSLAPQGVIIKSRLYAGLLLGLPLGAMAGDAPSRSGAESAELAPVIVRERRTEPADAAAGVASVDRATLADSNKSDFDKVLRGLPGITLIRTIRGVPSSFAIRGAGSGHGQIIMDGIPLYSTLGTSFNFDILPPEAIEGAEVERGASVVRHGSLSSGGAIRLTGRNAKDTGADFHLQGGTFGTLAGIGSVSLASERARATLTGKHEEIYDGISQADSRLGNRERDGFRGDSMMFRYAAQPAGPLQLDGTLFYADTTVDLDSFGIGRDGRPGVRDDPLFVGHSQAWVAQQTVKADLSEDWQSSLQLGYHRSYVRLERPGLFGDSDAQLLLARWRNRHTLYRGESAGEGLNLTWGTEAREEEGHANGSQGPFNGRRGQMAGLMDVDAAYGPWTLAAGGRFDHYDQYGTHGAYYLNSAWQLTPEFSLRVGAGHVYRIPTFHEWNFPIFSNPALRPESSNSSQFGFDWTPDDRFRLSVTGFYHYYKNKIRVVTTPETGINRYYNMPESEVAGVEWDSLYQQGPISVGLMYTFQGSQDLETGLNVPRIPEHQGKLYGEWRLEAVPLSLSSEILYRSGYYNGLDRKLKTGDAWWVNLQAMYTVVPELQVYVRGENLSNDKTPDDYRYGKPGAAVYGGIKVSFR